MKIWKKITASFLATLMLLSACSAVAFAAESPSKSISNRYLTYSVNDKTGFFSIGTLEGHPQKSQDNNMNLLYAGDSVETSFTTVRLDGKDYIFGQDYGIFGLSASDCETKVDAVNNAVHTTWTIKGVKVTQSAYLSRTDNVTTTGNLSLAYSVENTTEEEHKVGIRVMLDNALGAIDAPVPMVESELAPISKESEFFANGRKPGDYIRYIDNIDAPTKEAFVVFDSVYSDKPDRMVVGHWYNLASAKWDYKHDANMAFTGGVNTYAKADTATAFYWNEETLPANTGRMDRTFLYGVGNFSVGATKGAFNVSLELDDSGLVLNSDGTAYQNHFVEATVTLHNNVDGSEDLLSPVLNLSCDEGAFILYDETDTDLIGFESITEPLGHLDRGRVRTLKYKIAVDVPEKLSTIAVIATVTGNDDDHKSSVKRFIYAPAKKVESSSFAVTSIGQSKFHISGNRIFLLKGSFDETALADRTKWAAALVSEIDPSLRYEIRHEDITVSSETDMALTCNGDIAEGRYGLEFSFFEEYKEIYGNTYTFDSIEVVNNSALIMSQASCLAVVRRGQKSDSTYEIKEFYNRPAAEAYEKALPFGDEMVMLLTGEFNVERSGLGHVQGYSSTGDVVLNDVLVSRKGSRLEHIGSVGVGGVRFTAKDEVLVADQDSALLDVDSKVECFSGHQFSLLDGSLRLEPKGFNGTMFDLVMGPVQFEFGVLGKDKKGYNIHFGGTLNLIGYDPTAKESDPAVGGYEGEHAEDIKKLGRTGRGVNLTCAIDRVLFDKNGFVGVDTTTKVSYVATNVLGCAQMDKLSGTLKVNTIDNEFGMSGTVNVKGFVFSLGISFAQASRGGGVYPDDFNLLLSVPPTKALGPRPAFGFYLIGLGFQDIVTMIDKVENETPAEYRKRLNQSTMDVNGTIGVTLFEVILLNGTLSVGANHANFFVSGSVLVLPGFTFDLGAYSNWKQAIKNHDGQVITPQQVTFNIKGNTNFIDIYRGGLTLGGTHTDKTGNSSIDPNMFVYSLYGGLYLPKGIPIVGGTELLGATGTLDSTGIMVLASILGIELGVSYAWGGDVLWLYEEGNEAEEMNLLNNAQYVVASKPEMELLSDENHISGEIESETGYGTLIGITYHGKTPGVKDLKLTVDGVDYPLTAADGNYQNGNCFVMPDLGEGGRVLVGIPDAFAGKHTYTLTAPDGIALVKMEAMNFTKTASAKSVKGNGNGTVTVEGTKSLQGSRVELYYINDKEAYENIRTEEYTDEKGEKKIRVYKEVNGKKVELDEAFYQSFAEHMLASVKVTENTTAVTLTPEIPGHAKSGEYYLMAVVRSPHGKLSRCLTEEAIRYTNPHQPLSAKSVSLVNVGNGALRAEVISEETEEKLTGYFVSLYNETDQKYEVTTQYYQKDETILFEKPVVQAGKQYHAEISCVNVFSDEFVESADTAVSAPVSVREPQKTVMEVALVTASKEASYTGTDGIVQTLPYLVGKHATVQAKTNEPVHGRFVVDQTQTAWTKEKLTEFTYTAENLPNGKHTMYFESKNSMGDITLSEPVTFVVTEDAPAFLLDNATAKVQNGTITVSGLAHAAEKVVLMDKTVPVEGDGRFTVTVPYSSDRYAERLPLKAVGYNGTETEISVIAVNPEVTPIDSIVVKVNGESKDEITLKPGETASVSALGSAAGQERSMDEIRLYVHEGNNLVTLAEDGTLTALSSGVAYVKAAYSFGTVETDEGTKEYAYEDILKINIVRKTRTPYGSIPDGASITTEEPLEISGEGDIYYTVDGSVPTAESDKYKDAIYFEEGDVTVKAIAIKEGFLDSDVAEWHYTVEAEEEETSFRPGSGGGSGGRKDKASRSITSSYQGMPVNYGFKLTLTPEDGGVIYYTTDGTTPNKESVKYEGPIVVKEDMPVRAVAWYEGDVYSKVQSFDIKLNAYGIFLKQNMEKEGLMGGYPDGTFRPDAPITRAETATVFRRATEMYGYEIDEGRFTDIEMWAKDAICRLAAAEVVNGYPDGTFRPDNPVTRAEFITMLMRIIGETGSTAGYSDTEGHWAEKYIAKAKEYGYINGYEDGSFGPDASITRAEALAIMSRVFLFEGNGTACKFTDVSPNHWAFGYIAE